MDKTIIDENKRLMSLNQYIAEPKILKKITIALSIILFLISNFIIVSTLKLPSILLGDEEMTILDMFNLSYIFKFWLLYVFLICFIVAAAFRFVYLVRISYAEYNVGQKGTARWTDFKEIQEQYKEIPEKTERFEGYGGVPVCRFEDKIYIDDSTTNNLIIGITRSGKGEMFVFPLVDIYSRAEMQASMIVTDPKLELYSSSKETLEKRGYQVEVLNLIDPENSMQFNPLTLILEAYKAERYSEAELLCNTFSYSIFNPDEVQGDKFWAESATACLSALIIAHIDDCLTEDKRENIINRRKFELRKINYENLNKAQKKKVKNVLLTGRLQSQKKSLNEICEILSVTMSTVNKYVYLVNDYEAKYALPDDEYIPTNNNEKNVNMYSIINTFSYLAGINLNENTTGLDVYFEQRPDNDRAKRKYAGAKVSGNRTKGSIFSYMMSKITVFTYENIAKMTLKSTLDLNQVGFGDKPVAVFLGIPDYDKSNHFIVSVFIRQLYFVLAKSATHTKEGKCKRKVAFILDEFGNIPAIENMANIITVCLGRNIQFNLVIQSYSQIEKLYGKDSDTIIGNCGNQIYILTNDKNTAEKFSSLIGSETITNVNRSGKKMQLQKNITETYDEKPLINPNQLMELKEGECIIKRVTKRKDLNGNDIIPTPIYNKGKTQFKYRYQYMLDDFPNKDVNEINIQDNSNIDLSQYVFDIKRHYEVDDTSSDRKLNRVKQVLVSLGLCSSDIEYTLKEMKEIICAEHDAKNISEFDFDRIMVLISEAQDRRI